MSVRQSMRAMAFGMFCLLATAHAAPAEELQVTVTGNVTVNGKALTSGRIIFYLDDDQFVGSKIKDGAYTVKRVPVGACRVAFEGEGVPAKAASENSGFTVNVQDRNSVLDFDMKGR